MPALPAPPLPDWIERQLCPGTRRFLVDVGGYRVHVSEVGEGDPVLLLHGNPTWSFLYRKVAAALAGARLRFTGPVAIVWGDRDPVLGRLHKRIEALLPKAVVTRTDAGHFLQEEVPEQIAASIRSVATL